MGHMPILLQQNQTQNLHRGRLCLLPQGVFLWFGYTSVGRLIANDAFLSLGQSSGIADLKSTESRGAEESLYSKNPEQSVLPGLPCGLEKSRKNRWLSVLSQGSS